VFSRCREPYASCTTTDGADVSHGCSPHDTPGLPVPEGSSSPSPPVCRTIQDPKILDGIPGSGAWWLSTKSVDNLVGNPLVIPPQGPGDWCRAVVVDFSPAKELFFTYHHVTLGCRESQGFPYPFPLASSGSLSPVHNPRSMLSLDRARSGKQRSSLPARRSGCHNACCTATWALGDPREGV
jgi:hypothetical protein